jgi:hypothetical protein
MNTEQTVFDFGALIYLEAGKNQIISSGLVRVDLEKTQSEGSLSYQVLDMEGQVYSPSGIIEFPFEPDPNDLTDETLARVKKNLHRLQDGPKREELAQKLAELDELETELNSAEQAVGEKYDEMTGANIHLLESNFLIAVKNIQWINHPDRYIVEQAATEPPRKRAKGRMQRLAEKSRHIVLKHDEIRKRWAKAQGTHASPMPHLRRGHFKNLQHERFKEARGRIIWVRPTHVKGKCIEWRQDGKYYKVL